MKYFALPIAAACLAAVASAQDWLDDGAGSKPQPSSSLAPTAQWSDDFNRADGPIGGSWAVISGTWAIVSNQGAHTSAPANELLQHTLATSSYTNAVAELDVFAPGAASQFSGLVLGWGGSDAILVKIQDQDPAVAGFSNIGIYHRTSSTSWGTWAGTGTGFSNLVAPFTSGRLRVYFSDADTVVAEIDTDFDGLAEQVYTKTGVAALAPNLGSGFAISGWGSTALFDNFAAQDTQVHVRAGDPYCQGSFLDFDSPLVPSGPISSTSSVFPSHGIGWVRQFGVWTAGGDSITIGSNDSGQSLVVQGTGAGTLAVAGPGEVLSNPSAGAGFELQLNRPVRAFGFLFIDQAGMSFAVELFSGGASVGAQQSTYPNSFPAPSQTVTLVSGCAFDRVRISFPGGTNGVGIDRLWLDDCFGLGTAGGNIPTAGTGGGGVYPTTLPPSALEVSLALPADARTIDTVGLINLTHTWAGDLQFVLFDPSGVGHNLANRIPTANDFGGNYFIVESGAVFPTTVAVIPSGSYAQYFGGWPNGTNNIFNTPLSQVPVVPLGVYTLRVYDWAGGDIGALGSFYLFGKRGEVCTPFTYCVPGVSSSGCVPAIGATANPNVALSTPCVITATNVEGNKNGLLFYGLAPTQSPWCATGGSSFLCVKPPTQRTINQLSGGANGTCAGVLSLDWNAYQLGHPAALGNPFSAGDVVYVQGWFRDPLSCKTTSLTGGLGLVYQP